MKLGSSRGMDTKRPRGSERSKPCHELQLTRPSQPPYPWPPEQAQSGVSKPYGTTLGQLRGKAERASVDARRKPFKPDRAERSVGLHQSQISDASVRPENSSALKLNWTPFVGPRGVEFKV